MNSHKQESTINLVIHDISATNATNEPFSFLVKRTHQIIETNEFYFDDKNYALINSLMKFNCNFKLNGKKEWKKKMIELKLIKDTSKHKAKVVGVFKIDLSEIQRRDIINSKLILTHSSIGVITLNYTLSSGDHTKSISIDSLHKSNHISFPTRKVKTQVKISNLTAFDTYEDTVYSESDNTTESLSKSDEIANLCEQFDYQNVEKIEKIPIFAKKTAELMRDSIDYEGIHSIIKVLNKMISQDLRSKIYAGLTALYLSVIFEKRLANEKHLKQLLVDSLNEAFDYSISDLKNDYTQNSSVQTISDKIDQELSSYGSGDFFDFYIQSIEFAYASLYKKPKADMFFKAFHIEDKTYVSLADHFEQEDSKDGLSPVAEQITEHLLEVKVK